MPDPNLVILPNVRLSFPALWTATAMEEGKEPQFEASFLFDNTEHGALLDKIDALIDRIALDEWKKKVTFKRCLRDGNERSDTEGYGDSISFLTARNKNRPSVVNRDKSILAEADGIVYAGCYVNGVIRLFPWNHKTGGKGVSAQLCCVQFVKDGESFGAGKVNPDEVFENLDSDNQTGAPHGTTTRSRSSAAPLAPGRPGRGKPGVSTNIDDY